MTEANIEVRRGAVHLAGSLWTPADPPVALILMYPGSGPADRHNDVFFPAIREGFLNTGAAVASFDKRGVGSSSGNWMETGIEDQAGDLIEFSRAVRELVPDVPVGYFGHSQGGWVVLEASRVAQPDFLITSSGPSVAPRVQEEFSTRMSLDTLHVDEHDAAAVMDSYRELFGLLSSGATWDEASAWAASRAEHLDALAGSGAFIPDGPELWTYAGLVIDFDPEPALRSLTVPLLAMLGGADTVVPVAQTVEAYRRAVRPDLLTVRVVDGGDHRIQDPGTGQLLPDYLPTLNAFVTAASKGPT